MDAQLTRNLARLIAWGRVGVGCTALVAPSRVSRPWVGPAGAKVESRLLARTIGGRDLALGIGTLRALSSTDREARPWVALAGVADAVDALATLSSFGELPRRTRWGVLAITLGAAILSTRVAISLETPTFWVGSRTGPAYSEPNRLGRDVT
jgi:hypothetical protein